MIHYKQGDIFEIPADIRVNTVNCVGVMGAGVALAFKSRYPEMFKAYSRDCKSGRIRPGHPTVWNDSQLGGNTLTVINFPTKDNWRDPSEYKYIEDGLKWLKDYLLKQGQVSIALPALGCGHGSLNWSRVKTMIEGALSDLEAEIYVFEPSSSLLVGQQAQQKMTADDLELLKKAGIESVSSDRAFVPVRIQQLGLSELFYKGNLELLKDKLLGVFMSMKAEERETEALLLCLSDVLNSSRTVVTAYSGAQERMLIRKVLETGGRLIICPAEGLMEFKVRRDLEDIWDDSRILLLSTVRPSLSWNMGLFAASTELRLKLSDVILVSDPSPDWLKKHKTLIRQQDKHLNCIRYGELSPVLRELKAEPIAKNRHTGMPNTHALRRALGDVVPEENLKIENIESGADAMPEEEITETPEKKTAKTKAVKNAATAKKQKSIEETLWDSANKLRGSVEPSEYKHVVLSLIFLKFASEKFEHRRQELIGEGKEKYIDQVEFYTMKNVFFLPEISRWSYIKQHAKQNDIAVKIDTALFTVEKNNKALKGALPDNYFSRLGLDVSKLAALIDTINNIHTLKDKEQDIVGRVYEYFLSKFALAEGKGKGEFYTPKSIVNLIAEMIEPYKGKIYDPCCGSGGMFVQSLKFIANHQGSQKDVSIYGQEYTGTTYKLAKMNLAIRGISANLGEVPADTFGNDQHKDLKADYIMANPPFNQKDWRGENELVHDPRWAGYEVPAVSNANYGWILNMVSKLSENGVAGFILANGALSGEGTEKAIRAKMIENHLVEAIVMLPRDMFYTTDISVTLWILNKNKKAHTVQHGDLKRHYRDRREEILFMDLRQHGEPFEKKYIQFSEQHIQGFVKTFHDWQQSGTEYKNVPEYCYSANIEEVRSKNYSLVPSKYIVFINRDENIDFDEKMAGLQAEFSDLLKAVDASKKELLNVFKELGYEIKL